MNTQKCNKVMLDPFSGLMSRFWNDSFAHSGSTSFSPKTDISETDKEYQIQMSVPGLKKEDFKVELHDNMVTIHGERKFSSEKEEKDYHSIETQYGSFGRSFYLPENVSESNVKAQYVNGILELVIPKDETKSLRQTITVN